MKNKILDIVKNNSWFFVEIGVLLISIAIFFSAGIPYLKEITDWSNNDQVLHAAKWLLIPGFISVIAGFLAFKEIIIFLLDTAKVLLVTVTLVSFSILWNPLPFTSCYYDLWMTTGLEITDKSNFFLSIGGILTILSIALFYRVIRVLKTPGITLWLFLTGIGIGIMERADYISFEQYSVIVFLSLWFMLLTAGLWIWVQKLGNTKGSEDPDTN